ncbi:UDP-glucose 4-epimerase family protein [Colwellia piezophila]|uniref:UDP-glucose 4-epimerase family protein n=1 Tax=Colwellia piezophila TaxID=211668 RepID=UPI00036A1CE4|nr:SDR family oxidoreductase [Colwellia piezophila]
MNILLTGANGFLGKPLLKELINNSYTVTASSRRISLLPSGCTGFGIVNIDSKTNWSSVLSQQDIVIHCAARVHVMDEKSSNPLEEFREVNTRGTINLAKQAANAGVKRFIFISSIKVGGESSLLGTPLTEDSKYVPDDPYGLSKYEAEQQLLELAKNSAMEVVIIRPTLIYGPGVKANFETMMNWASKPIPLPFGAITNKRSLVSIDNLISLIEVCLTHPNAKNEIFYVNDDNDVSTSDLLRKLYRSFSNKTPLIPMPMSLISLLFKLIGKGGYSARLLGSLQVDISKAKTLLNWTPPYSVDDSIDKTVKHFIKLRK